jgi:nuclear pore complex protein Nup98-Nup96
LFGSGSTSNSTFGGGFGATNNTTSAFGGGNTGGGIFGQNKPAGFGSTNPTTGTGGLFGGGNTSGGFGANNTTGGFGASTAGGFGANSNTNTNNGTAGPPFQPFTEKDPGAANGSAQYQTITFQQPYSNYSLEELRSVDYAQGRRYGNQNGQAGAFGQSTGFGGFGANNNTTNTAFGANNTSTGGGLFGGQNNTASTPFGSNTNSAFGSNNNSSTSGGGVFGQNKPAGGLFGASTTTPQPGTTGGLFGSTSNATTSNPFGATSTNNAFGASTGNTGGGLFGQNNAAQNKPAFGGFGSNTSTTNSNPFGGSATNTGGGLFGQQNHPQILAVAFSVTTAPRTPRIPEVSLDKISKPRASPLVVSSVEVSAKTTKTSRSQVCLAALRRTPVVACSEVPNKIRRRAVERLARTRLEVGSSGALLANRPGGFSAAPPRTHPTLAEASLAV